MPIYEYQCMDCAHRLEAFQKMSDEPLVRCPACGAEALRKQVSAVSFRLKGTGWYVTDFRDKGKAPEKGGEKKAQAGKEEAGASGKEAGESASARTSDKASDKSAAGKSGEGTPATSGAGD